MAFRDRSFGQFLDSQKLASEYLVAEIDFGRPLNSNEGVLIQAASHILLFHETFRVGQITELTFLGDSTVKQITGRFEESQLLIALAGDRPPRSRGEPQRLFRPTELGAPLFNFFQEPGAKL